MFSRLATLIALFSISGGVATADGLVTRNSTTHSPAQACTVGSFNDGTRVFPFPPNVIARSRVNQSAKAALAHEVLCLPPGTRVYIIPALTVHFSKPDLDGSIQNRTLTYVLPTAVERTTTRLILHFSDGKVHSFPASAAIDTSSAFDYEIRTLGRQAPSPRYLQTVSPDLIVQ